MTTVAVYTWDSQSDGEMSMESITRRHEPLGRCRISPYNYDGSQKVVVGATIAGTLYVAAGECRFTLSRGDGQSAAAPDSVLLRAGQFAEFAAGRFSLEIRSMDGAQTVFAWAIPDF